MAKKENNKNEKNVSSPLYPDIDSQLADLKKEDIKMSAESAEFARKDKKRKITRNILLVIFSALLTISGTNIVKTLIGYKKAEDSYAAIQKMFYEDIGDISLISESQPPMPSFGMKRRSIDEAQILYRNFKARISALKEDYPDIYGWILMPDMEHIDYPVMQCGDNNFYLNHDWQGKWLEAGAIFVDFNCSPHVTENRNTVIYGHNMLNGMMFSDIAKFTSKEVFDSNPYVYLFTLDGVYTFTIFSFYKTDYKSGYIETYFPTTQSLVDFCENSRANSLYYREGVQFTDDTRILTLSTCTDGRLSDRYCLQAVLTEVIE